VAARRAGYVANVLLVGILKFTTLPAVLKTNADSNFQVTVLV